MNTTRYQDILQDNIQPLVWGLKLKHTWIMQQVSDPKQTSNSTDECLKKQNEDFSLSDNKISFNHLSLGRRK